MGDRVSAVRRSCIDMTWYCSHANVAAHCRTCDDGIDDKEDAVFDAMKALWEQPKIPLVSAEVGQSLNDYLIERYRK